MKKILSIFACLILACTSFAFVGCKKSEPYQPPRNVVQNLPDKLHVEYSSTTFVKDGNEYYCWASNTHGAHRSSMYMKRELNNEYCIAEGYGGWNFITAIYYPDAWVIADTWNENDKNQNTYTNAEYATRHGYSDVNSPLDSVTNTQLADQTITLVSGQQVECVVWESVFEYNDSYTKDKYWFAKDTGVYIKGLTVYDRETNIDTDGSSYNHPVATYYAVGETMATVLETKGLTAPDLSAYN